MFEARQTADLVRIAAAGGGSEINGAVRPTADLVRMAAASAGKGRIIIRGMAVRPTEDLVRIAAAGQGSVVFADDLQE